METEYTTRVYQYGAVPLGPFPEEGVEELFRENRLWNNLVEIHDEHNVLYDAARRGADQEYGEISQQLLDLEKEIDAAFVKKRTARMKAQTRDAKHPLIAAENEKIDALMQKRRELWEAIKKPRQIADGLIDKKALNSGFNGAVKVAQRVKNMDGLSAVIGGEVYRNFKEARSRWFTSPQSKLRFHRFDGTGYFFYRLRDKVAQAVQDGVTFDFLMRKGEGDRRAFILEPNGSRRGVPRLKLRAKVAGGVKEASKVYATFDVVLHRPIPEGAQINNVKLMRNRVGDRFKYTVNFSVRVPLPKKAAKSKHAIGVDIGFRQVSNNELRAAVIHNTKDSSFETVNIPKEHLDRMTHVDNLRSRMDQSATELGNAMKIFLESGDLLPEGHGQARFVQAMKNAIARSTLSFEQAYKLNLWILREPGVLPEPMERLAEEWFSANRRIYREMHHLRKKTLLWRKETYRILANRLVAHGLPIGLEKINLSRAFAEVKKVDNKLANRARLQRFLVSPSEFINAIRNAAQREGGVGVRSTRPEHLQALLGMRCRQQGTQGRDGLDVPRMWGSARSG